MKYELLRDYDFIAFGVSYSRTCKVFHLMLGPYDLVVYFKRYGQ